MNKIWLLMVAVLPCVCGCARIEEMKPYATNPAPIIVERTKEATTEDSAERTLSETTEVPTEAGTIEREVRQAPTQVKGIYISAYVAGTPARMEELLAEMKDSEINAVVIDLKGDEGYITCEMDSPLVTELGTVKKYIPDIRSLMTELKANDIYTIARIAAFRDPLMGERKPEWCLHNADGTLFKDNSGMAWINPYEQESWEYLVEVGTHARELGFDEVQFDYIRFCTERGMNQVVINEADTNGRSRAEVITEFMAYAYQQLKAEGLYVSADVFGAVIDSGIDSDSVGQVYSEIAKNLDYISPMIYPSHYADGYYGIDHPDKEPYDTITAALSASEKALRQTAADGQHVAVVRPWLQDFTASYLENYITYGDAEVRAQIQATYDAGYDEWLLWNSSARYTWDGLLTIEEAMAEADSITASRVAAAADAAADAPADGAADTAPPEAMAAETTPPDTAAAGESAPAP